MSVEPNLVYFEHSEAQHREILSQQMFGVDGCGDGQSARDIELGAKISQRKLLVRQILGWRRKGRALGKQWGSESVSASQRSHRGTRLKFHPQIIFC